MTVVELIALLAKMPQDARVRIYREGYPILDEENDPNKPEMNADGEVEL